MRPRALHRHRNLERLIQEAGSISQLARLVGTSPSYLSQVRNRTPTPAGQPRGIGDRSASMLETGMGTPAGWLDEPHSGMEGAAAQSGSAPWRQEVDERTRSSTQGGELIHGKGRLCPLVSWVQAGDWSEVAEVGLADDVDPHICPVSCGSNTFALRVKGESMEPEFREGDVIFVDPDRFPNPNNYVVVCTEATGEATFKKLIEEGGQRYLRAVNPAWPNPIVEARPDARICGVVVYTGRQLLPA